MDEEETKSENGFNKTWTGLLLIAGLLFFVVGSVMVTIDNRYLNGFQYLFTSALFFAALYLIRNRRLDIDDSSQKSVASFKMGFIFSVVGLNINVGVWGLGVVLFLSGLFNNKRD